MSYAVFRRNLASVEPAEIRDILTTPARSASFVGRFDETTSIRSALPPSSAGVPRPTRPGADRARRADRSTVLLLGATGTGKELFATRIHELSARRSRAMVRVNCAAIPSTLMESELFGRERGAFTDAVARQIGRFELATTRRSSSTRSVTCLGVQVKLLRVLEERRSSGSAAPRSFAWTCGSSRPRTAISSSGSLMAVPRGPVLPAERLPDSRAAAARARRGHSPAGVALRRGVRESCSASGSTPFRARRWRGCSDTPGRATSASCEMPWSAR